MWPVAWAREKGISCSKRYLQPLLSLLFALHCQHQGLGPWQRETQLMLLAAPILGHIDDAAGAQGHLQVWLPVLGAFVALKEVETIVSQRVEA